MSRRIALTLLILSLGATAQAGPYSAPAYSGGVCTLVSDGQTSSQPYTGSSGWGNGGGVGWGTKTLSNGTVAATSGNGTCSGTVTAKFT